MPSTKVSVNIPDADLVKLDEICQSKCIRRSEALRLAIHLLVNRSRVPDVPEELKSVIGNPNVAELGRTKAGPSARWGNSS